MIDGETLYGWMGRYHRLSGYVYPKGTSMLLFGDFAGFKQDFLSQLDHFVSVTNGVFGDAETLAHERSLWGFFTPFQPEIVVNRLMQKMKGKSVQTLKFELGLLSYRLGAFHRLKACPDCIREDIEKYSISTWHLEHQWPTSWVCRRHRQVLNIVKRDLGHNRYRNYILPQEVSTDEWEAFHVFHTKQKNILIKVVDFTANFALKRQCFLDRSLLRYTYLIGAMRRGWIQPMGFVKPKLWVEFQKYYAVLNEVHGYSQNQTVGKQEFVAKLMNHDTRRQHPTRHYLLMAFLFDSIDEFDATYAQVRVAFEEGGFPCVSDLLNIDLRRDLRRLLQEENMTINRAANTLNIEHYQAAHFIEMDGIVCRRNFVLDAEQEQRLKELLIQGVGRREIELEFGMKKYYFVYYLCRNPHLRKIWRERNCERIRNDSREQYQRLLEQKGAETTVHQVQCSSKKLFNWLRNHDFDWLIKNSPPRVTKTLLAKANGTPFIR